MHVFGYSVVFIKSPSIRKFALQTRSDETKDERLWIH